MKWCEHALPILDIFPNPSSARAGIVSLTIAEITMTQRTPIRSLVCLTFDGTAPLDSASCSTTVRRFAMQIQRVMMTWFYCLRKEDS
jgi:hypothetical protein